jgi:hypothetical protein
VLLYKLFLDEQFYLNRHFVDSPFDRRKYPEFEVINTHLDVHRIDDFTGSISVVGSNIKKM